MTPRLALWAGALLLTSIGCAQSVSTTGGDGGTTTSSSSMSTGGGGAGGATGGTTASTCTEKSDCVALNDACHEGACVDGMCAQVPANDNQPCDDGDPCTVADQCGQGQCHGITKSCGQASTCHINKCNSATGLCEEVPGDNGAQCDDNDPCTYFGTCQNGSCAKGQPIDCSVFTTECTIGSCDPAIGCVSKPAFDGYACDDGLFCTLNTVCANGVCGGGIPMPCAPVGGCFVGTCDELNNTCTSVPGNDGAACDDGSPCTASTTCANGVCGNGVPANEGVACDDGTACTVGEVCQAGACGGGVGPQIFLSEDFSDNSAGWQLGPEWQIGPAVQGFTNGFGNVDPDTDHSPTADDGIAGAIIGGDVTTTPHAYSYLVSPPFDTSTASGAIILGYYRWLNSDSDPYMHNRIDVWNGNQWITVWASGQFMFESSWSYQQHDLTNYKNAAMRIRFGFDMKDNEFSPFTGWNIDDVLVASQACP